MRGWESVPFSNPYLIELKEEHNGIILINFKIDIVLHLKNIVMVAELIGDELSGQHYVQWVYIKTLSFIGSPYLNE